MKPMRKGTRSCRECRRRKIRCLWPSHNADACSPCSESGRQCLRQGYILNRARYTRPGETKKKQSSLIPLQDPLPESDGVGQFVQKPSPLFDLFNNAILSEVGSPKSTSSATVSTTSPGDGAASDLQMLQAVICQEPLILDILDVASDWFISWRDLGWALKDDGVQSLRGFVQKKLASENPVIYASGLLCLALSLQHLQCDQNEHHSSLSASPIELFQHITTAVDQIILSRYGQDENLVLVCLQRAKVHAEGSQVRQSWLRIRQAITLLQHSGFANDFTVSAGERMLRQRWVGSVLEMDRFLSLILGLPYAADKDFTNTRAMYVLQTAEIDLDLRVRAIRRIVAIAAEQINDRNTEDNVQHSTAATHSIQAALDNAATAMPREWWYIESHLGKVQPKDGYEQLTTQLWFWQIQCFLHLPHMLQANGEESLSSSRVLCLKGARDMLMIYCVLRNTPSLSVYLCSCDDFQGVLTACILLIGLLLPLTHGPSPDDNSLMEDFELLQEVKDILKYRAHQHGNLLSLQGLKAIEGLESFLTDEQGDDNSSTSCSIVLPYFGVVKIESQKPLYSADRKVSGNSTVHPMSSSTTRNFSVFNFGSTASAADLGWSCLPYSDDLHNWGLDILGSSDRPIILTEQ